MATLGDVARGTWPREFGRRPGTVFSYVMSNYTPEGYPAGQGGEFTFRYALTSGPAFDPVEAGRFGWSAMAPLATDEIRANDKSDSSGARPIAAEGGFVDVDQPNIILVTMKRAEDGEDLVFRLLEIAGKAAVVNVRGPLLDVAAAWRCSAVEDKQQPLVVQPHGFRLEVKPFEIATVRVARTRKP
jgi:alpha-mannosidase